MRLERLREEMDRWGEVEPHRPGDTARYGAALAEVERAEAVIAAARGFEEDYSNASISDEEGLLANVDPDVMRELWRTVDVSHELLADALAAFGSGEGETA